MNKYQVRKLTILLPMVILGIATLATLAILGILSVLSILTNYQPMMNGVILVIILVAFYQVFKLVASGLEILYTPVTK